MQFDKKGTGHITEEEFLMGISQFCKCSEEQKIKRLYDLYLLDEQDVGISFDGFLCILRNYPQEKLSTLLNFLKTLLLFSFSIFFKSFFFSSL